MQNLIFSLVKNTVQAAGLNPDKVFGQSKADNLTLPRPRLELQFLPETYQRTGRLLAVTRANKKAHIKKELYEVKLPAAAQVFAKDESWLDGFIYKFLQTLPRGLNDRRGNWVAVTAARGEWEKKPPPRLGSEAKAIEPIKKCSALIHLNFTWRVTQEEIQNLLAAPHLTIKPERI